MKNHNLFFLYITELCAGFARGSYLVCIGWTTLIVSGDVAVVGQVFIVAMITTILVGPIVGVIVDRYNRKHLTIFVHLGMAASLASLGLAVAFVRGVTTKENAAGYAGFLEDFSGGLALFRNNHVLRVLTILAGVALPIGQLSNAILSSFIRDDLGRGSEVFGLVDAAWPVGGMAAAAILKSRAAKVNGA